MNHSTETIETILACSSTDSRMVDEFLAKVALQVERGCDPIRIDCSSLIRVASSNVNTLWLAHETCLNHKTRIELTNVGEGLRRVLDALDLSELFLPSAAEGVLLELTMEPTIESIDSAMSKAVGFLTLNGVPEITTFELQTVFYEIATNIRRHGRLNDNDLFWCTIKTCDRAVELTFVDKGIEFDPVGQCKSIDFEQASRAGRRNGFGLEMIRRLSKMVKYERTSDQQNQLIVYKSW